MVLLENDAFLTELTKLYERTRAKGSVSCVMKITKPTNKPRPKGTKRPDPTLEEIRAPGSEYGVLVRLPLLLNPMLAARPTEKRATPSEEAEMLH